MNSLSQVDLPTIDTFISRDVIKKLKPKEKKRQDVLNELQHTEKAHVRNLKVFFCLINFVYKAIYSK